MFRKVFFSFFPFTVAFFAIEQRRAQLGEGKGDDPRFPIHLSLSLSLFSETTSRPLPGRRRLSLSLYQAHKTLSSSIMASAVAAPALSTAATAAAATTTTAATPLSPTHHPHYDAPAVPSTSSVLRRVIPWDTYVAAKLLDPGTDAASLRAADKLFSTRRAVAVADANSLSSSSSAPALPSRAVSPEELAATAALLAVLRGVTKEETVQYVLAVLDAEVSGNPRRARELFDGAARKSGEGADDASSSSAAPPDAADLFLLALSRPDWFSVERAASLLEARFGGAGGGGGESSPNDNAQERQRGLFLDWILAQLQRPGHAVQGVPAAAGALSKLLRCRSARNAAANAGAPRFLVPLLQRLTSSPLSATSSSSSSAAAAPSVPATPQLAYDLCISLWQLALTPKGAEAAVAAGAVPALTDVLRSTVAAKEKVVRAAAQALKALLVAGAGGGGSGGAESNSDASAGPSNASSPSAPSAPSSSSSATATAAGSAAVACGLSRLCDSLLAQQWDDPDVSAALQVCREGAAAAARRAASWPVYRAEVLGGRLTWGPAHDGGSGSGSGSGSEAQAFWAANAKRLEERDAEVLRTLVRLLEAPSSDARTLAVACSDLARYADASNPPERARALLTSLGANRHATRLLAHSDPEVRRHALGAVQRIVLSRDKLQYLNS